MRIEQTAWVLVWRFQACRIGIFSMPMVSTVACWINAPILVANSLPFTNRRQHQKNAAIGQIRPADDAYLT
jgi:hypothetical protein